MKRVHSSQQPVRQISENLSFGYLPLCETVSLCFRQLEQKLKERSLFEYLLIENICPTEPHKKYEYIQKLKEKGLSVKAALLTYLHGNNVSSLHFVWKILESVDNDISESQQTIGKAKAEIPIFHTQAVKTDLASKSPQYEDYHSPCPVQVADERCLHSGRKNVLISFGVSARSF